MFSSLKKAIGISEKPTDCDGSKSCNDLILYEKFLTKDWGFHFHKDYYKTLNQSLTKLGLYRLLENVIKNQALVGTEIIRFKSFLKCVLILMIDSHEFKYESEFNLDLKLTVDKINSVDGIIKNSVFKPDVCKYVKSFLEVFFKFFTPKVLVLNPKTGKDLEEKLVLKTEPANQPTQTLDLKPEPANQAIQALALRVDELTKRVEAMENKAGNSKVGNTNPNKNSKQVGNDAMPKRISNT